MIFLLDTNALVDLAHDRGGIRTRVKAVSSPNRVVICTIVRGEVLHGLYRLPIGKRRDDLQSQMTALLGTIPCESVPADAAEKYATTKLAHQQAGLPMDENDLWIAATALAMGAVLITRDSDFQKIAGLVVEDWTA